VHYSILCDWHIFHFPESTQRSEMGCIRQPHLKVMLRNSLSDISFEQGWVLQTHNQTFWLLDRNCPGLIVNLAVSFWFLSCAAFAFEFSFLLDLDSSSILHQILFIILTYRSFRHAKYFGDHWI
jgi:hypothetical protein